MEGIQIRYITPFSRDLNIGKSYNEAISELPDDCYIVLRDGDTCFLTSDWGNRIHNIIEANPDYGVIGCMTNRVGLKDQCVPGMFGEAGIGKHIEKAHEMTGTDVKPALLIAGFCMIFHKSVWKKCPFKENTIVFDRLFCYHARLKKYKIGIATGLYMLHLYRFGKPDPQSYKEHLNKLYI